MRGAVSRTSKLLCGLLPRRMPLATERSFEVSLNDSGDRIDNRVP
jgi:hypothetical protein